MLKTIDLFAGAGGLSLGFEMTGEFELVAAAEINKNARATYKENIAKGKENFVFIDNVKGYDFAGLNQRIGGIDIVIGGPPCQGFSNANRQKNHLISMNNELVKEFFRAIKEIRPMAFVMENVSMLRSDTHRFYQSKRDNEEIQMLIANGFDIPQREDTLYISDKIYENINFEEIEKINLSKFTINRELFQLLNVLRKNIGNKKRLPVYIKKHADEMIKLISKDIKSKEDGNVVLDNSVISRLKIILNALSSVKLPNERDLNYKEKLCELEKNIIDQTETIEYILSLQKMIKSMDEIEDNALIGKYGVSQEGKLIYKVNSYSVNDYVNAILGGEYKQVGNTVNAEWFGVPQDRRRHIVLGLRKDLYPDVDVKLPEKPEQFEATTVWQAIADLVDYEEGYTKDYGGIPYREDELSDYAKQMRRGSSSVKNHLTTKTTETARKRFEKIEKGKNFHSLSADMKSTYSNPERTQNTIYLRLEPDKPSGTVVNVRKSMWIHPTKDRAVTVREAARLQSFPDSFVFIGTKDSQFQQVGNAVPPLLAKEIANQLLKYIKNE